MKVTLNLVVLNKKFVNYLNRYVQVYTVSNNTLL